MVILLKVVLGLICLAIGFSFWSVLKDYRATKSQEGFDEISIWDKIKFNLITFSILSSMVCFVVFMFVFIFSKITIG